jgi:AcrR family transcriptional regulator
MLYPDRTPEKIPLAQLLAEAEASGTDIHTFWMAPRSTQLDRYRSILLTTLEIAREGGYEAVQMRAVAERSGIAVATVYRYFTSRDNLVYRAMIAWSSLLTWRAHAGSTKSVRNEEDRLVYIETLMSLLVEEPTMLECWVRSTMTNDELVVKELRAVDWSYWSGAPAAGRISDESTAFLRVVTDIFYAGVVRWAFGQEDIEDVVRRTRDFARSAPPWYPPAQTR